MLGQNDNTIPQPYLLSNLSNPEDGIANKIVEAFSNRARHAGIRSIAMCELSKELRTSTKTIYKVFPSKADLVHEIVVRWESRIHQPFSYNNDLIAILRHWVNVWVENHVLFSPAFWQDLKTDFPELHKVYVSSLDERLSAMKERVSPYLKSTVNPEFAWKSYTLLITSASKPKTFEKIGMTREQCVYTAFDFWVNAALDVDRLRFESTAICDPQTEVF